MPSTDTPDVGNAVDLLIDSLTLDEAAQAKAEAARILAIRISEALRDETISGRDVASMNKELRATIDELVASQADGSGLVETIFGAGDSTAP